jgi:condensin complex subunit 1
MAPPFVFPSSLRDLERDTDGDGDEEPSLRPQNPVAVATLRAADLEEFVKGTCRHLPAAAGFVVWSSCTSR